MANSNPSRARKRRKLVQVLTGANRSTVCQILARHPCAGGILQAARAVFATIDRQTRRTWPHAIRRGLVACIIEEHRRNQQPWPRLGEQ